MVCDVDDTVWSTGLRHPLRAAWRTLGGSSGDRRPVAGMATLLGRLVEGHDHPPVVYLSNGPWDLAGPVARFLDRQGFPAGALLLTDRRTSRRGYPGRAGAQACIAAAAGAGLPGRPVGAGR